MKATELIGKFAIRTGKTGGYGDNSYTSEPVFIMGATDTHIEIKTKSLFNNESYRMSILNYVFCDDKWIDFEENFSTQTVESYRQLIEE